MTQNESSQDSSNSVPSIPSPEPEVSQTQPKKRGFHLNKWKVVSIILVIVVIAQLIMFVNLSQNHQSLLSSHDILKSNYDLLETQQEALEANYNSLETQYNSLQSDYESLDTSYDSIRSQYNSLKSDYDSLDATYDSLQHSYNSLQAQHNTFVSNYYALRDSVNQRSQHDDVTEFITPNDPLVNQKVIQITGGWSNPSDFNEFWSDVEAMFDWVVNNIDYRYDGFYPVLPTNPYYSVYYRTEMWQFPNETLNERKGDCEDMSILLTSMILNYNEEKYWVECIWIESSSSGHVAVQIPVAGDKLTILDPAGNYYTSDYFGNIDNIDISTEINDWLDYWKPTMGNDVHVERVFSNSLDKPFSLTSDYISWMYNR